MKNFCLLLLALLAFNLQAQDQLYRGNQDQIISADLARKARVEAYVKQTNAAYSISFVNAPTIYLHDIIKGKPIYRASDNLGASVNTGANALILGDAGLKLTGKDLRLLIWEEPGGPRDKHVEYVDRLLPGGDFEPNAPVNHSTHVTGTIIASGINPEARGMAPEAGAVVYNFNGDDAEIAQELSENAETMILSNHSYGVPAGWRFSGNDWDWFGDEDIDENEDWKFGFYNSGARTWDQFIYDAPYYLMVKSAGNSRSGTGDGTKPPNGPYDIVPFESTAKNIVTVGATQKFQGSYDSPDDIVMSNFSSWGPTDDGRIKPDISAPGVSIVSSGATSDESYISLQGTSMSSPVVMGNLALVQELSKKLNGSFMKASTLKALLLHTAFEAGASDGPDYQFGWGFINAKGMTDFLLKENGQTNQVKVATLQDGDSHTFDISPKIGTQVKVTMVWTDVPGTPVAPQLNPETLMLVNDLDLRLSKENETHLPWILDPAIPNDPASKGDNFRDNVEKIEFESTGGTYSLSVSHKASLSTGAQEYSLIVEYIDDSAPKTLYWIGNSGAWEAGGNWSLTSGGDAANIVPDAKDKVVFDLNSFKAVAANESFEVAVNQDVAISELNWFSDLAGSINLNGNNLALTGDIYLPNTELTSTAGTISLNPTEDVRYNIASDFNAANLVIEAGDHTVELVGDGKFNQLRLNSGKLLINNANITLNELISANEVNKTIEANNSTISVKSAFDLDAQLSLNLQTSKFIVPTGSTVNGDFNGLSLEAPIEVQGIFSPTNLTAVSQLYLSGELMLSEDLSIEAIEMSANSALSYSSAVTLMVSKTFVVTSDESGRISIEGPSGAVLNISEHQKICTDFVDVNGVNFEGEATLSIGTNSTVEGATGWVQTTCDQTLFSDFDFSNGCQSGLTFFENKSSGPVSLSDWSINGSAVQASSSEADADAFVSFDAAGNYDVTLAIEGGGESRSYTRQVEIVENTIASFEIIQEKGFLVSTFQGSAYQWFKDDQPIVGETTRQLETEEEGSYTILVGDGTCNKFSEVFEITVTSITEEENPEVLSKIGVYPNPAEDQLTIALDNLVFRDLRIGMIDLNGRYLVNDVINKKGDLQRYEISLAGVRKGMYIIRLVLDEESVVTKKVLVK